MNFEYFVLLLTLKNIVCNTTKREIPISSNLKHLKSKTSAQVTPARYQVVSKTSYDPVNTDYFPAVEHPSSVIDASKPFYVTSSPFSDEVTTLFKSLSDRNNNAKTTTEYNWKPKEAQNEKGKEILKKDNTDVTLNKEPKGLNREHNVMKNEPSGNHAHQHMNISTPTECDDMDYVIEFINDLDEFMKNITNLEAECKENNNDNTTVNAYESDRSNEFKTVSSVMTSNDSIIVLNGNSFSVEDREQLQDRFVKTDAYLNSTLILDDDMKNTSIGDVVDDMLANFCSIETTLNESNSNTSCTG